MGLGKTVEIIALILQTRTAALPAHAPPSGHAGARIAANATLIVTPLSIVDQWASELAKHAPCLVVHRFLGSNKPFSLDEVANSDVVLVTYDVLAADYHRVNQHAGSGPRTGLRHEKRHSTTRHRTSCPPPWSCPHAL